MLARLTDPRPLAVGRTVVGLSMLAQPALLPGALGVDRATRDRMAWAMQMLGAREIALGVGSLRARRDRRGWLLAGLFSDAVDALVVAAAVGKGRVSRPAGGGMVAVAAAAVAVQAEALRRH